MHQRVLFMARTAVVALTAAAFSGNLGFADDGGKVTVCHIPPVTFLPTIREMLTESP
jgi:hypothetical protein